VDVQRERKKNNVLLRRTKRAEGGSLLDSEDVFPRMNPTAANVTAAKYSL